MRELLASMSEGALGPAGGTAASIAGALGVSLLMMVTTLPPKRARPSSDSDELRITAARLQMARDRLTHLAERDAQAYAQVIEARRRPNSTPAEKLERQIALQHALRRATDVPLDMMHTCDQALRCGSVVASHAIANARGDLAIGIELLCLALHGAARAIEANLRRLTDERYVANVTAQCRRFEVNGTQTIERIQHALDAA